MTERRSPTSLVLGFVALAAFGPALAFVADASITSVVLFDGLMLVFVVGALVAHRRARLTPALRRALSAFALCAVWSFGAYSFYALEASDPLPEKWFELTHFLCMRGEIETLLDLFWIMLCPVGVLFDVFASIARLVRLLADLSIPVLALGALIALVVGARAFAEHRRMPG